MKISPERKRWLRAEALIYAGELVRQVMNTYEEFIGLIVNDDEQKFMDDSIRSIGERLWERGSKQKAGLK